MRFCTYRATVLRNNLCVTEAWNDYELFMYTGLQEDGEVTCIDMFN